MGFHLDCKKTLRAECQKLKAKIEDVKKRKLIKIETLDKMKKEHRELEQRSGKLAGLTKTEMERSDLGFKAFKNVRGTTPYFEAKKKDLFAMIRQIGPPNIFFTKSVHETSMLPLIPLLQEKDKKKIISTCVDTTA